MKKCPHNNTTLIQSSCTSGAKPIVRCFSLLCFHFKIYDKDLSFFMMLVNLVLEKLVRLGVEGRKTYSNEKIVERNI